MTSPSDRSPEVALTREQIYNAIWPRLAQRIRDYAAEEIFPSADTLRDAEADAINLLLDAVEEMCPVTAEEAVTAAIARC